MKEILLEYRTVRDACYGQSLGVVHQPACFTEQCHNEMWGEVVVGVGLDDCPVDRKQWSLIHLSLIKDGRATDSCFSLVEVHQCGVLMYCIREMGVYMMLPLKLQCELWQLAGNYCLSLLLCKHRHIHIKLNPVISSDPVQPQGHAAIELLIVGSCHLSPCTYTGSVSFLLCIVYGFPGVCVSCGRVCRCALASRSKGLTETVAIWSEEVRQRQR